MSTNRRTLPAAVGCDSERFDNVVGRFEDAWRLGEFPSLDEYLSELLDGEESIGDDLIRELVLIDLEWQWRRGDRNQPRFLEDYLIHTQFGTLSTLPLEIVEEEYRIRHVWGDRPGHDEFQQRFPGLATVLESRLREIDVELAQDLGAEEVEVPDVLGRYRIHERIGAGGFGVVYRAFDEELQRDVAVKVPHRNHVATSETANQFLAEAQTIARLDHPAIVPVYDVGRTEHGVCYVVTKYIDGSELTAKINEATLPWQKAVQIIAEVADALHHAHLRDFTHRDVKPANILLDSQGKVYLTDFGLALREDHVHDGHRFVGTPSYMSPEQARSEGHRVDGRSDIFSLGIVLYELLTGRRPFRSESSHELLDLVKHAEARPPRQLDDSIPRELERICLKALSKRISDRYSTAADLALDLRTWNLGSPESDTAVAEPHSSDRADGPSTVRRDSTQCEDEPSILPKGLRAFDADDAGFFLDLLPGPRSRDGLPALMRFWKTRIEGLRENETFTVGMLYGPSGCGKSSLVKAGLLPCLSDDVVSVYLEATQHGTEADILSAIQNASGLAPALSLSEALSLLRMRYSGGQSKILIVIDQFEQWLHENHSLADSPLIDALRQCDGTGVQCLLLVRDDFWLSSCRFMQAIEVEMMPGENIAVADLFDVRHAEKVLTKFGQAYNRLPRDSAKISADQRTFVRDAVASLAQDGRVVCVQLALFAELMKGRDWNPASLSEFGGIDGLGVLFLHEKFESRAALPTHRLHESAARHVLKALLPTPGSDLKGARCSRQDLQRVAGYERQPKEFEALIRILDHELRLITPADTATTNESEASASEQDTNCTAGYQLTHDYLVASLREWLTQKQRESVRGRAELRLSERSMMWRQRSVSRHLPGWWEWVIILIHTHRHRWSVDERQVMSAANRHHLWRAGIVASLIAMLLFVVWSGYSSFRAQSLVDQLLSADIQQTERILSQIRRHPGTTPLLQQRVESDIGNVQLRAAMGLVHEDPAHLHVLQDAILKSSPREVGAIVSAIPATHRSMIVPELWESLERNRLGSGVTSLAMALARLDPPGDGPAPGRWKQHASQIAESLLQTVIQRPDDYAVIEKRFHPVADVLIPELNAAFKQTQDATKQQFSARLLGRYWARDTTALIDLLGEANARQFQILFPHIWELRTEAVPILQMNLTPKLPEWISKNETAVIGDELKQLFTKHGGIIHQDFAMCANMASERFLETVARLSDLGLHLRACRTQREGDVLNASAVWTCERCDVKLELAKSAQEIRNADVQLQRDGFQPVDIHGHLDADGTRRYTALWRRVDEPETPVRLYVDLEDRFYRSRVMRQCYQEELFPTVYNKVYLPDGGFRRSLIFAASQGGFYEAEQSNSEDFGDYYPGLLQTDVQLLESGEPKHLGVWRDSDRFESRLVIEESAEAHLEQSRRCVADGFRPVVVSQSDERRVASVWHRPIIASQYEHWRRVSNYVIALYRLGETQTLWPLLGRASRPDLRSLLIENLHAYGGSPATLCERLQLESDTGVRAAIVLALGQYPYANFGGNDAAAVVGHLEKLFKLDGDAGLHSAVEWTLRKWGRDAEIQQWKTELIGVDRPNSSWFVNSQGQTFTVFSGPITFEMGTPGYEPYRDDNEHLHQRLIDRSFAVNTTEVTYEQYERFLDEETSPRRVPHAKRFAPAPDCPRVGIRWYEVAAYCNWLSRKEGLEPVYEANSSGEIDRGMRLRKDCLQRSGYRLLTRAEREYATMGGTDTAFCFGDDLELLDAYAWHSGNSNARSWPVGRLKPNDFGIFDAHGNAWEWCHPTAIWKVSTTFVQSEQGRLSSGAHIAGGSFMLPFPQARSSASDRTTPTRTRRDAGLRIGRTLRSE